MLTRLLKLTGIVTVSAVILAGGCAEKTKSDRITILYPNWAEGVAITYLARVALEDRGYRVDITPIEPGPIYASLAKGDADLFLDAWLPNTHRDYWAEYGSKIDKLGESFREGTTGLVVPSYVPENSIPDLKKAGKRYGGKIIGIGSGAGIHRNTEKIIKAYGLSFRQITSSGPAMIASLEKAYASKKPVVITGWKPHFMWARFKLKYLADPKKIYPRDVIAILARKGFASDRPKVAAFFKNFTFREKELYSLMKALREDRDELTAAKKWYAANRKLLESWWK